MSLEETFATMQRLPSDERARLLAKIELWLEETRAVEKSNLQSALAVVKQTWASVPLTRDTMQWVAESKELEYDIR